MHLKTNPAFSSAPSGFSPSLGSTTEKWLKFNCKNLNASYSVNFKPSYSFFALFFIKIFNESIERVVAHAHITEDIAELEEIPVDFLGRCAVVEGHFRLFLVL